MLKKSANFVLASLRGSTYETKYASILRSLRPHLGKGASWRAGFGWVRRLAFLNILLSILKRFRGAPLEVLSVYLSMAR
jgi:hypothetical protein